ncbi:MAG: hypothetical protein V2I35_09365 [Desulfocapsaceae bacterium]|jgi:hypothetical protein|nr:hypothetical protein [Desulfocapsaceae bacterium]
MRLCVIILVAATLTISCGRIPEPVGYVQSEQNKMQATHHWDVLAADLANQINNELILNDYLNVPVFVRETCGDENTPCPPSEATVFEESFRDLLITNLVSLGVPTRQQQDSRTLTINYKTQAVYHHRNRWRTLKPGLLTALTAGVLVIRNAPAEMVWLAAAGTIDFANAAYVTSSNFEVLITTSIVADGNYLFRSSNIYYINDQDSWHYQRQADPAEINLTSSAAGATSSSPDNAAESSRSEAITPKLPYPEAMGI